MIRGLSFQSELLIDERGGARILQVGEGGGRPSVKKNRCILSLFLIRGKLRDKVVVSPLTTTNNNNNNNNNNSGENR